MDSTGQKKISDEKVNNPENFDFLNRLILDWYKLLTLDPTNFLKQLHDQNTTHSQDQVYDPHKLVNEAYVSHANSNADPVLIWFKLCEAVLENAKNITQQSLNSANGDSHEGKRREFMNRQIALLFQPRNFLWSNRQAIEKAIKSNGESIQKGFCFLSKDLSSGTFNLSLTKAFVIGENIARTKGHVVYKNDLIELIQYEPATKTVKADPILIVPPFINKFYILDLQASNSLVQHLVTQGITVFMISWKNPTAEDGHLTWDDYITNGVLSSIDTILNIYPRSRLNIGGYCIGGTLAAVTTAISTDRIKGKIASLTMLNTLLDFSDVGEISNFISKEFVTNLDNTIGKSGIFRGSAMASVFSALRSKELIWDYVENVYLKGEEPTAFDFLHWNADNTNIPGPLLSWYLKEMYLNNNLKRENHLKILGRNVNLSTISCPCFVVASRKDHIVPWHTAYNSALLLNSKCEFILASGGHVAGIISPHKKITKETHYSRIKDGTLRASAEGWLNESSPTPGSWWGLWTKWLKKNSGKNTPRRKSVGNKTFKSLAAAPGEYVRQ